jgi:hypothetical protein
VRSWCSVEELTRQAFDRARVVMANEAHNGLKRCVRTREVGVRMIQAAHDAGVRRLAMEALPWPHNGTPGPIRTMPQVAGGYLAQPDMRGLIGTALGLGWSLWAYEAVMDEGAHPANLLSLEFTNWREREQAVHLCEVLSLAPAEPLLVWTGNGHATREVADEWVPMGHHFAKLAETGAFVIDQTVSVFMTTNGCKDWMQDLLASLAETLAGHGGTAGILREHAPPPLDSFHGVDALIVSTDNGMT